MRKYNTRFIFYTTKSLKKEMKKRARELDIPMADYIRTLIRQDLKLNAIANNNVAQDKNFFDMENYNKKLSGYFRGL